MRFAIGAAALVGCVQAWPAEAEEWPGSDFKRPTKSERAASARAARPRDTMAPGQFRRPREADARPVVGVRRTAEAAIEANKSQLADAASIETGPTEQPNADGSPVPLPVRPQAEPPAEPARQATVPGESWKWRVLHLEWTAADERGFETFVRRIGQSDCKTTHECLTSTASNPAFHAANPPGMRFFADCADLPYLLRAYYAWQNGLPFSFANTMRSLSSAADLRYNNNGNQVGMRKDLVSGVIDARSAIPDITTLVTTAQFRTAPEAAHKLLPDHYPVGVTRDSIKPGTTIYDAYGHIAVVYDVTPEGRVLFMDSHPDNSLTRGLYGRAFHRQAPAVGGGFKRWRPLKLVGATRRSDGSYAGGRIELAPDRALADWSDEVYYGTETPRPQDWRKARFAMNGQETDYYRFVRLRLAPPGFRYDPIGEVRTMVRNLCREINDRRDAVDIAIKAKIHRRAQPARLPYNIYGTDGDWEIYSTPSRDARLKTDFKELRDEIARFLELAARNSEEIRYAGEDLRRDLRDVYRAETDACSVSYTRSNGAVIALSFHEVAARLFNMSFDPHHCTERRWGATAAKELASCPDNGLKQAWYDAQKRLRNQVDRHYDARMDFTLAQLRQKPPGSGADAPPDIDVLDLLHND